MLGSDGGAAERDSSHARSTACWRWKVTRRSWRPCDRLCTCTREVARAAGLALDDVDLFVYHQANSRILAAVAERLELPRGRVFDCIAHFGNTSAASVPLALSEAARPGALAPGRAVVLGASAPA